MRPERSPRQPGRGTIRAATIDDIDAVRDVSAAAGERFREIDDPRIARHADDPPISVDVLRPAVDDGRLWVACHDDAVVGFLLAAIVDGVAHVEEVSVRPEHQGRGHGGALLDAVGDWASSASMDAVTLTTFRDVPWNRPYYERRGYRVLEEDELGPELRALRAHEVAAGLDPDLRVVMRRSLAD
jgi:GNAT superfamily N-acetyltransferase